MKRIIIYSFITALLLSASCRHKQQDMHTESAAHQHTSQKYTCPMHPQVIRDEPGRCPVCGMKLVPVLSPVSQTGITLTDQQIKLAGITTGKVQSGQLLQEGLINGVLKADEQKTEQVSLRAAGRIEKLFVKQTGEKISKGDPLFQLYSEELEALQQEYLLAWEQYKELGEANPRYSSLVASATKKLLLYGLQRSQIEALKKTGRTSSTVTFYSPYDGIVTDINALEGEYLPEGGQVYRLEDLSGLWVEGQVYSEEVKTIRPGSIIRVQVQGFEDGPQEAKVTWIGPATETGSQLVNIRANIPNPGLKFRPGMQVRIVQEDQGKGIPVPAEAVIRGKNGALVFIRKEKNSFESRKVTTGTENSRQIEITGGLNNGEIIATNGAYLIYSEMVLKKGSDPMAGRE